MATKYKTLMVSEATKPHIRDYIQSGIWVETDDDPKVNGANLIAAYTLACALTPNGSALATDNRACVIVPPGKYDLDHGEENACVPLILDTEFVDIIGLTTDRSLQHIYGTPEATNSGVIIQTANDVHISNLTVEILTACGMPSNDSTDSSAYFPSTNLSNTVVEKCNFIGATNPAVVKYPTRFGIIYSGTYINCNSDYYLFYDGSLASVLSGKFVNCTGIQNMCIGGVVSGTFINCVASYQGAFTGTVVSGTFINCKSGAYSFGELDV